ncbi:hypothetical protein MMC25_001734 [Agyrium rufum]|nr:hypothetical protein [Agyrium rufum]
MTKAKGVFRWAVCQLDSLAKCYNLPALRKALGSLPKTLDATYEAALCAIDDDWADFMLMLFQWLIHARTLPSVTALADVIAVDSKSAPWFDLYVRFPHPEDLLLICPSLLSIEHHVNLKSDTGFSALRLAHFSVQEYLISDRLGSHGAVRFAVTEQLAHSRISETCLAYTLYLDSQLHPGLVFRGREDFLILEMPLLEYALINVLYHVRESGELRGRMGELVLAFFKGQAIRAYWRLFTKTHFRYMFSYIDPFDPLVFTVISGADNVFRLLLTDVANVYSFSSNVGLITNHAAAHSMLPILECLFHKGIEVNVHGGELSTVLVCACQSGGLATVDFLIRMGALVDPRGGSPLMIAACHASLDIVRLLLARGADINASACKLNGTALEGAVISGSVELINFLVGKGASVNAQGCKYDTALQLAVVSGSIHTIDALLKQWADVNIQGGEYNTALQAAAFRGPVDKVLFLLERGADVSIQGGVMYTPLHAAALSGSEACVQLIIENGGDIDARGGRYGTPLQAALAYPYEVGLRNFWDHSSREEKNTRSLRCIRLLLAAGASVNIEGGITVSRLAGDLRPAGPVRMLLKTGSDI